MKQDIRVQQAVPADVETLLPMVQQYWRFENIEGFEPTRVRTLLARILENGQLGRAWIATHQGAPAGYLVAVYVFSLEHQGLTAEIDEFFVLPQARGSGVGRQMLATAEDEFRKEGCTNVSLQLGRSNEAARKFYLRHGFENRAGFELVSKML